MEFKPSIFLILSGIVKIINAFTECEVQLLEMTHKHVAPFSNAALERFHGLVFRSSRPSRSTDVAIINTTDKEFKLQEHKCQTGRWTETLSSEKIIKPHTSVLYGAESSGFMTGATNCVISYKSIDGSFSVTTSNPFFGRNTAHGSGYGVHGKISVGEGNNNIVRFILE